MRLRHRLALVVIIVALAGCAAPAGESIVPANMPELKEALGVTQKALPPLAKAQANATQVAVGWPVRFTGEGSSDPQALPLTFQWDFGDGSAGQGLEAIHVYATPGEYAARLTLTNDGGAADQAIVPVRVLARDLAPLPTLRVMDAGGVDAATGEVGKPLTFDATGSKDPEGAPLSYRWDFGDGATSLEPRAAHAFATPGAHVVMLTLQDAPGQTASVTRAICIAGTAEKSGTLTLTGAQADKLAFPVLAGLESLRGAVTFDGGLGANDLVVVLVGPDSKEAARSTGATPPGAQGAQTRVASADAPAAGTWSIEVHRTSASPAGAPYSLVVDASC